MVYVSTICIVSLCWMHEVVTSYTVTQHIKVSRVNSQSPEVSTMYDVHYLQYGLSPRHDPCQKM